MNIPIDESVLAWLDEISLAAAPPPWRSMVEGRDHLGGDSFIMVGPEDARTDDIYVTRERVPARAAELDVIAAARTYLPTLVAEIRRLRAREVPEL